MPAAGVAPVVIGDGCRGLIDEIAIRGRVVEDSAVLPSTLKMEFPGAFKDPQAKNVYRIYLTEDGRLDPLYPKGPVTIKFTSGNGKTVHTTQIGWLGTVEQ
jgi:hypothetical protein